MATAEDHAVCDVLFSKWATNTGECKSIVACSPSDIELRRLRSIFPHAAIQVSSVEFWNLNKPWTNDPVDLVTACNVFHYSTDPGLWFANVLKSCRWFWIQDLLYRARAELELGRDGDACRFTLGEPYVKMKCDVRTFDLKLLERKLVDFRCYDAGSFKSGKVLVNFAALIRGSVA